MSLSSLHLIRLNSLYALKVRPHRCYTGPHMKVAQNKFMTEVLSRNIMGIDMSGQSYAHDYGQHLIGELLTPEAYRNVTKQMSRTLFVIARNIAKIKNPFPACSEGYKYFEDEK